MRKPLIALALLLSCPTVAMALDVDLEPVFTYWGRANLSPRPGGWYDGQPKPAVEVECHGPGGHMLMSPDEARALADALAHTADQADAL